MLWIKKLIPQSLMCTEESWSKYTLNPVCHRSFKIIFYKCSSCRTTYITCPPDSRDKLSIKQPILNLMMKKTGEEFGCKITVSAHTTHPVWVPSTVNVQFCGIKVVRHQSFIVSSVKRRIVYIHIFLFWTISRWLMKKSSVGKSF